MSARALAWLQPGASALALQFAEACGEVSERGLLFGDFEGSQFVALLEHLDDSLDDVIDMALGVDTAGDGESDEFHGRRLSAAAEHDTADFDGADTGVAVERADDGLSGELGGGDVWAEVLGVDVDGVSSGRFDDLDSGSEEFFAEVFGAADAVLEIILVDDFFEALGHGFEIAACEASVGEEAFGEDEEFVGLSDEFGVAEQEQSADIDEAVFLGADGCAVGEVEHFADDVFDGPVLLSWFAFFDEVGVFGESAGIKEEG